MITFEPLTLKRVGGGRNPPKPTFRARHFVCDLLRSVKPSCIFHFWCLKQVKHINLGGCIENFSKILSFEKKNFVEAWSKILKNLFFTKISQKMYCFRSNLSLECCQLSFDIHIAYVGQKLRIFKFLYQKQVNFQSQTRLLRRPLLEKLYIIGMYSMTLLVDKDPNFHLRSCLGDLDEK